MSFKPPKGWDPESDTLFIHANGVRIELRVYRDRRGWFLIPTDLAQEVVYFDPTPEGRDQAFATFDVGLLAKTSKKKALRDESMAKAKRGRKPKEEPKEESEEDSEGDSEGDSEETTESKGPEEGSGKVDKDS
jgi:mannose/cellobiose epimerase-like protein (N-acyl-D-glucosamine 2-epimerase family)